MGQRVLLHACCAPCSVYSLETLRGEGIEVRGLFYNPYIQPLQEFQQRMQSMEDFAKSADLSMIWDERYEIEDYIRQVAFRETDRCRVCYYKRLERAAKLAKKSKLDAFTTTMLYSKQQNHELIRELAQAIAKQVGIPFLYRDFRLGWKDGIEKSKALGLYRQQYCGCILSERDRYQQP